MKVGIIGLGTATPRHSMSQMEFCNHAKIYNCQNEHQVKKIEELYRRTNISKRHNMVVTLEDDTCSEPEFFLAPQNEMDKGPSTSQRMQRYHSDASELSTLACRAAISNAAMTAAHITHLVTVSCTGFSAPGFDLQLYQSLELNGNVQRTHIGFMGCHGALNALRVAQGLCAVNEQAVVLVCATEICSLHFQYGWDRNNILGNALFADGSAAMIVARQHGQVQYTSAISYVIPNSNEAITWQVGDNGFTMTLSPQGSNLIEAHLPAILDQWLKQYDLDFQKIAAWAIHPGGPKILNAVQNCLALSHSALEPSRQILSEYGNMSSPTVIFILERLLAATHCAPCVMLGFGPGMTIEAALFT